MRNVSGFMLLLSPGESWEQTEKRSGSGSHSANLVRRYKAERIFVWSRGGGVWQHTLPPPQHTDGGNYPRPRINRTNVHTTVPASRRDSSRGTRNIIVYIMLNALTLYSFLKDKQLKHKIQNKKWHTFYVIFVTLSPACGHLHLGSPSIIQHAKSKSACVFSWHFPLLLSLRASHSLSLLHKSIKPFLKWEMISLQEWCWALTENM